MFTIFISYKTFWGMLCFGSRKCFKVFVVVTVSVASKPASKLRESYQANMTQVQSYSNVSNVKLKLDFLGKVLRRHTYPKLNIQNVAYIFFLGVKSLCWFFFQCNVSEIFLILHYDRLLIVLVSIHFCGLGLLWGSHGLECRIRKLYSLIWNAWAFALLLYANFWEW